jgi:hypothetical protein
VKEVKYGLASLTIVVKIGQEVQRQWNLRWQGDYHFYFFSFISDWYLQSWCSGYSSGAKIQLRKTSSKDLIILASHV